MNFQFIKLNLFKFNIFISKGPFPYNSSQFKSASARGTCICFQISFFAYIKSWCIEPPWKGIVPKKKKKDVNNRGISRDFLQKFCYIFSEFYMLA